MEKLSGEIFAEDGTKIRAWQDGAMKTTSNAHEAVAQICPARAGLYRRIAFCRSWQMRTAPEGSGTVWTVGTPRCGVPGRVQRPELLQTTTIKGPRCAAERGADSAARCPYPQTVPLPFSQDYLAVVQFGR